MSPSVMDTSGKILFVCPSCGYRAKIPPNYLGMSIRCPGCNGAQTVVKPTDKAAESTGKTVTITKVAATPLPFTLDEAKKPTAAPAVAPAAAQSSLTRTPLPGSLDAVAPPSTPLGQSLPSGGAAATVTFTCTACAYRARIPATYASRNILCPKCNAAQVAPALGANTGPSTGNTVRIDRVATTTPAHGTLALPDRPGASAAPAAAEKPASASAQVEISDKILFTCASCGMRARLPAKYAGNTIKCPKCSTPGTVPLSDAMEAATGTTVSISRAEIAKNAVAAAKRPSGEIAMPAAGQPAQKRPSGEIAMPPAAQKRPSGEFAMPPAPAASSAPEIDLSSLDKAVDTSPFQGQAVLEQKPAGTPAVAAADADEQLDFGAAANPEPPKKGGVVRRRGSSSSSNDIPRSKPAAEAKAPEPKRPEPKAPTPRPPDEAKPKKASPSTKVQADTEQVEIAERAPAKPPRVSDANAVRAARPRDEAPTPVVRRGMPWPWVGAVVALLLVAAVCMLQWRSTSSELDAAKAKLAATETKLAAESKRADQAEAQDHKLTADLDKSTQEAADLRDQTDKLTKKSDELTKQLDAQKTDLDKQIVDLTAKLDEQKRALEAAQQGFKNTKPK